MKHYITEPRKRLIAILRENPERLYTADELAAILCSAEDLSCSVSTVYRLLARLSDEGVVRKRAKDSSRKFCYQYIDQTSCHDHLHLKCESCGKLIHMDDDTSESVFSEILRKNGFSIDEARTLLVGECATCRYARPDSRKEGLHE